MEIASMELKSCQRPALLSVAACFYNEEDNISPFFSRLRLILTVEALVLGLVSFPFGASIYAEPRLSSD